MKQAEELGCQRVAFPGEMLNDAKAMAFAESHLFILPTYSENFGLVVAEALSHGVPVVTTRGAPWQGLETHRCGWWTSIDEDGIHAALSDSLARPSAELADMGQRGRRWVEREYGWSRIAEMTETTYEWLLGGAPRPSWVV